MGKSVCVCACTGMSGWGGCFEGQDVFATVRENSHMGQLVAELVVDTEPANGIHWSLTGQDADWFFLEGINLRLNTSSEKVLDREVSTDGSCFSKTWTSALYYI